MKATFHAMAIAVLACLFGASSQASPDAIKIGVLTDLSGPYSGFSGSGSVVAAKMAAEDFGGTVLGKPIVVLAADHQNKPDIGMSIARAWLDVDKVDMIADMPNSSIALAVQKLTSEKQKIAITSSSIAAALTGSACSPTGFLWTADGYALAKGPVTSVVRSGLKKWFFLTVDNAGGYSLEASAEGVLAEANGTLVGHVRHPLGTQDFSSFLLQAQASGADVIGLASGGTDVLNLIKQASEFGITPKQKLAAMYINITDIKALGLKAAQGLLLTDSFYWDRDEETRKFSRRFEQRQHAMPTGFQAGVYSATLHYLKSVAAAGTDDGLAVSSKMRQLPVDDVFAHGGVVRADGKMVHNMYFVEVKSPDQQKEPWDLYTIRGVIPAKDAFPAMDATTCSLVHKQ